MQRFGARTHPGRRAGANEDAIGWNVARGLWFVADGLGGHASGQVASGIARQMLTELAEDEELPQAVRRVHEAIVAAAGENEGRRGMGATLVAAQLGAGDGRILWVGDSRAYLWRGGELRALTKDHSFVEQLREHAGATETELRAHPQRNVVTQALGIGSPEPSLTEVALQTGDWILLCSDGLTDELTDEELAAVLRAASSPEEAAEALVSAALGKGGRDNVSAVVVQYEGPSSAAARAPGGTLWLPILCGVLAAALLVLAWWWFER